MAKGKVIQRIIELKDKFSPGLGKIQKGTLQFKRDVKDLKKVGSAAFKGIAIGIVATGVAAVGAGVGFATLVNKTAGAGREVDRLSQMLGMSRKEMQQWDHAMESVGYSAEQASGDIAALAEKAMDASMGVGEGAEMFGMLGVKVTGLNGKLKTQEQLFNETITALQGMEDITKRNAIASAMLSTTGEELVPILNMTSEELEKLKSSANVISDKDIENSIKFKNGIIDLKTGITGMFYSLTSPALPTFNKEIQWLVDKIPTARKIAVDTFNAIKQAIEDNSEKFEYIKSVFLDVKNGIVDAFGSDGEGGGALNWFINEGIPSVVGGIANVFTAASATYNFFKNNWSLVSPIIYGIVVALATYYTITKTLTIAQYALTAAQWLLNIAMNANPLGIFIMLVGLAVTAGVFLIKNWDDVMLANDKVWNGIVGVVEWGVNKYIDYVNWMIDGALVGINFLIDKINKIPGIDIGNVEFGGFKDVDFGIAKVSTEGREFKWGKKKEEDSGQEFQWGFNKEEDSFEDILSQFDKEQEVKVKSQQASNEGQEFQWGFNKEEDSFEDILAQFDKEQEVKVKSQQASNDNLIASLDSNTNTMKGTAGGGNTFNITVNASDLTAEEIADKLVQGIERKLCG